MPAAKRAPSSGTKTGSSKPAAKRPATGSRATRAAAGSGAKATATSARKAGSRTATQAKSAATKTRKTAASGAAATKRASGAKATAKAATGAAARTAGAAKSGAKGATTAAKGGAKSTRTTAKAAATRTRRASGGDGITSVAEQLVKGSVKPSDLVMLTRDRIQETLDDAASRGRVTRKDANELVTELVRRGRSQSDDLLSEIQGLLGTATRRARSSEPVDRIVRGADRARRAAGVGPTFPILGYDELNAGQVQSRLKDLTKPDLRKVLTYERKNSNRKTVVGALEKAIG